MHFVRFAAEIADLYSKNPARWKEMLDKAALQEKARGKRGRRRGTQRALKSEHLGLGQPRPRHDVLPSLYMRLAIVHDIVRRGKGFQLLLQDMTLPKGHKVELEYQSPKKFICHGYEEESLLDAMDAIREDLAQALPSAACVESPAESAPTQKHGSFLAKTKRRRRRRAPLDPKTKPLTTRQTEAMQVVAECQGSFSEAGKRMGCDPKTVREYFHAAYGKMGISVTASLKKMREKHLTSKLPEDSRGQVAIAGNGGGPAEIHTNPQVRRDKRER